MKSRAEETPSLEFLEFLGQGVQVEDEFLDPVNYQDIDSVEQSDDSSNKLQKQEQADE